MVPQTKVQVMEAGIDHFLLHRFLRLRCLATTQHTPRNVWCCPLTSVWCGAGTSADVRVVRGEGGDVSTTVNGTSARAVTLRPLQVTTRMFQDEKENLKLFVRYHGSWMW